MDLTKHDLKYYADKYSIYDLSSEELIKLINKPYLVKEIAEAFNITTREFDNIRKQKEITNIYLEDTIRNIEVILDYIDYQNSYISNKIRKELADELAKLLLAGVPQKDKYIKKISEIDFTREKVRKDLISKEIDKDYRINSLEKVIEYAINKADILKEQEKEYVLNDNKELYNELYEKRKNGKQFSREDLTYDILFELSIKEGIPDSLVADLFNISKNQLRYMRRQQGLSNKFMKKIETYPEALMYYMENKGLRDENITNYDYERMLKLVLEQTYNKSDKITYEEKNKVIIDNDNTKTKETYNINFSNERYHTKTPISSRRSKGAHHNYSKENETRIAHGKAGEKIVLEAEKQKLQELGFNDLINEVQIVAEVNDEITFDGLGYDIISFNESRERICIEVKTSYGAKDKPFFITRKEIDVLEGVCKDYNCKYGIIYYVLINGPDVTIKTITRSEFNELKKDPYLYIVR